MAWTSGKFASDLLCSLPSPASRSFQCVAPESSPLFNPAAAVSTVIIVIIISTPAPTLSSLAAERTQRLSVRSASARWTRTRRRQGTQRPYSPFPLSLIFAAAERNPSGHRLEGGVLHILSNKGFLSVAGTFLRFSAGSGCRSRCATRNSGPGPGKDYPKAP